MLEAEVLEIAIGAFLGLIIAITILIWSYDPEHKPWDGPPRE